MDGDNGAYSYSARENQSTITGGITVRGKCETDSIFITDNTRVTLAGVSI